MYLHALRNRTEKLTIGSLFHMIRKLVEMNVIFNMYPHCLSKLIFKMKMLSSNYIYFICSSIIMKKNNTSMITSLKDS